MERSWLTANVVEGFCSAIREMERERKWNSINSRVEILFLPLHPRPLSRRLPPNSNLNVACRKLIFGNDCWLLSGEKLTVYRRRFQILFRNFNFGASISCTIALSRVGGSPRANVIKWAKFPPCKYEHRPYLLVLARRDDFCPWRYRWPFTYVYQSKVSSWRPRPGPCS